MNPLMTIKGTLAVGFILAMAVAFGMGSGADGLKAAAMVWLHVMAGVVWIGLLYYFNFVQVPGVGALATIGGGMQGIIDAFTFAPGMAIIGMGAWLGTIMLFNVWVLIWPNQKKILGLDGKEHSADVIAGAKKVALMASRTNTALSIPMLLCMVGYAHALA